MSEDNAKARDHLANERTYLAWVRTGIAVIALGFVIAKFGLLVRELAPSAPTTSYHFSSIVGIAIVLSGGLMEIFALLSFLKNRQLIKNGKYETTRGAEIGLSIAAFIVTVLLVIYLIVTL